MCLGFGQRPNTKYSVYYDSECLGPLFHIWSAKVPGPNCIYCPVCRAGFYCVHLKEGCKIIKWMGEEGKERQ